MLTMLATVSIPPEYDPPAKGAGIREIDNVVISVIGMDESDVPIGTSLFKPVDVLVFTVVSVVATIIVVLINSTADVVATSEAIVIVALRRLDHAVRLWFRFEDRLQIQQFPVLLSPSFRHSDST